MSLKLDFYCIIIYPKIKTPRSKDLGVYDDLNHLVNNNDYSTSKVTSSISSILLPAVSLM